jgi:hypothetical protein
LEFEIRELSRLTKDIADLPYDPEPWLHRGQCLRLLGYPELALGDVYKARLLVEAALGNTSILGTTITGNNALLTFGMKIWWLHTTDPAWEQWKSMITTPELLRSRVTDILKKLELQVWAELMEGLIAMNACHDYVQLSREAVAKFPSDGIFPSELINAESWFKQREEILQTQCNEGEISANLMHSTLYNGGVFPVAYPWMTEDIVTREDTFFQQLQKEFKVESTNCIVARSAIRNSHGDEASLSHIDVFGVVATRNIALTETVLIDRTVAGVLCSIDRCATCCSNLSGSIANSCCSMGYCSDACAKTALETFHAPLCSRDFTYLYDAAKSAKLSTDISLDSLLLLRVLALAIHEGPAHPLKTSLLARLTPAYEIDGLIIFNFPDHIITPIRILQELGVDVFANSAYDSWVIHTMRCRLQNNKHGQTLDELHGTAVNPLYSMFNHSCAPNIGWEHEGNNSTLRLFAERPIVEGEELFISYIKPLDLEWAERQQALMPWLGMDCECERCKKERPTGDASQSLGTSA